MSYCRFADDSDLYLYFSVSGYIDCCWCALDLDDEGVYLRSGQEVYDHLRAHVDDGANVRPGVLARTVDDWQHEFDDEPSR